jgi:hypothetical protein
VLKDLRYAEFINIWLKDAPEFEQEVEELEAEELNEPYADGCELASRELGVKSSCFECPFH